MILGCNLGSSIKPKRCRSTLRGVACNKYHGPVWPWQLQTRAEICMRVRPAAETLKKALPHDAWQQHPNMQCKALVVCSRPCFRTEPSATGTQPAANARQTVTSCMAADLALHCVVQVNEQEWACNKTRQGRRHQVTPHLGTEPPGVHAVLCSTGALEVTIRGLPTGSGKRNSDDHQLSEAAQLDAVCFGVPVNSLPSNTSTSPCVPALPEPPCGMAPR